MYEFKVLSKTIHYWKVGIFWFYNSFYLLLCILFYYAPTLCLDADGIVPVIPLKCGPGSKIILYMVKLFKCPRRTLHPQQMKNTEDIRDLPPYMFCIIVNAAAEEYYYGLYGEIERESRVSLRQANTNTQPTRRGTTTHRAPVGRDNDDDDEGSRKFLWKLFVFVYSRLNLLRGYIYII